MRLRRHARALATVALSLAASCSLESTGTAASINLYVSVDQSTIDVGESMNITLTARNVGYDVLTLTGPSDCLLFIEVLDNQGAVVYHSNGGCTGSSVTEELQAGETKVQTFPWNGSNLAGARLPPGFYHIRGVARLTGGAYNSPLLSIALEG